MKGKEEIEQKMKITMIKVPKSVFIHQNRNEIWFSSHEKNIFLQSWAMATHNPLKSSENPY